MPSFCRVAASSNTQFNQVRFERILDGGFVLVQIEPPLAGDFNGNGSHARFARLHQVQIDRCRYNLPVPCHWIVSWQMHIEQIGHASSITGDSG
jgi:hypothetical protein